MNKPLFAALLCVLFFATPSHAGQSARAFLAEQGAVEAPRSAKRAVATAGARATVRKSQARHPAYARGDAVAIAKRYLGTNPTKMRRLWCQAFTNLIERKAGRPGTGSNMARSALAYGRKVRLSDAQRGDILVFARGKGNKYGHSAYFMGWKNGRLEAISGNSRGGVVAIGTYSPARLLGVRRPA